jgi:hypothetical protein
LAPLKAKAKLVGMVIVRLLPVALLEAALPVMVHWLLESDAVLPRVMGPNQPLPASFCSRNVLAARLTSTKQPPAADREALTRR